MNLTPGLWILIFAPLLLAGCASTPTQRIEEKKAEFANLTLEDQQAVKAGVIKVGYTQDMVYMALGQPSAVRTGPEGETWEYRNYVPSETVASGKPAPNAKALAGHTNSNITAWDSTRQPSEGTARGDVINSDNRRSAPQSMLPPVVVPPSVTLLVFFQHGKVTDFKIER